MPAQSHAGAIACRRCRARRLPHGWTFVPSSRRNPDMNGTNCRRFGDFVASNPRSVCSWCRSPLYRPDSAAPTGYSRISNVLPRRTTKTPWNPPSPGNHEGGWLHLQPGPFSLVDAMEHYGNRRPRVERLVSAWNQGVHEPTVSTGESDDPLIGASVEPSKRPRTRLSDKEVDGRSCRFDTTAVLQNLTHHTSISQKRRRNALAIRGKRTFSLTRVVPSNRRHRDRFTPTQQNPRSRGGATVAPPPRFTRKQENPWFRGPATVAAPRPSLLAPRHRLETHPGRPGSTQRFSLKTDGEKGAALARVSQTLATP